MVAGFRQVPKETILEVTVHHHQDHQDHHQDHRHQDRHQPYRGSHYQKSKKKRSGVIILRDNVEEHSQAAKGVGHVPQKLGMLVGLKSRIQE